MTPKPIRALLIRTDGTREAVTIQIPHLESLYRLIECQMVECVRISDELDLWVDEEGKMRMGEKPVVNPLATNIALLYGAIFPKDYIAGNALLTGGADEDGEITDVPKWWEGAFS